MKTLTHQGETRSISEWAAHLGISKHTIRMRIGRLGWSVKDALTKPPEKAFANRHGQYHLIDTVALRRMLSARGWSPDLLAELTGLSSRSCDRMVSPGAKSRFATLDRVACALGCHMYELTLDDPLVLMHDDETEAVAI